MKLKSFLVIALVSVLCIGVTAACSSPEMTCISNYDCYGLVCTAPATAQCVSASRPGGSQTVGQNLIDGMCTCK